VLLPLLLLLQSHPSVPAWKVLEGELGYPLDIAALGQEISGFGKHLRPQIAALREEFEG